MNIFHILKIIGAAFLYLAVNVAVSVLVVAFYAHLINTGQPPEFYEEFARWSAPYSSIIAGMPLMFLWCWWLSRWWSIKSIIGIWIAYAVIDLTVMFGSGMTSRLAVFVSISLSTKLIAALLAAKIRSADRELSD